MRIMIQRTLILFVFRKHMAYKREKKSGMALNRYFKAYFFVTIVVQVLSYRCIVIPAKAGIHWIQGGAYGYPIKAFGYDGTFKLEILYSASSKHF